jgi:TetR/AcrR family transcriptional repressor of nem operon
MTRRSPPADTARQILDIAQRLVQTRGFNAFSYADIAAVLHVSKASLHYHFASKGDLGVGLIRRYQESFMQALARHDGENGRDRLKAYVDIYSSVLADQRMCLCGMLAAEFETLPEPMQVALDRYFAANEDWLARALDDGRQHGLLDFDGDPRDMAQYLIGSLEGAMMLSRTHGGSARFAAAATRLLAEAGVH